MTLDYYKKQRWQSESDMTSRSLQLQETKQKDSETVYILYKFEQTWETKKS